MTVNSMVFSVLTTAVSGSAACRRSATLPFG